jgi:hypothetical protein
MPRVMVAEMGLYLQLYCSPRGVPTLCLSGLGLGVLVLGGGGGRVTALALSLSLCARGGRVVVVPWMTQRGQLARDRKGIESHSVAPGLVLGLRLGLDGGGGGGGGGRRQPLYECAPLTHCVLHDESKHTQS